MTLTELNEIKMNYKVLEIAVDFINPSYNISRAKHLDTARYMVCTLTENGIPRSVKENEAARIRLQKPDRTYVYNDCDILEDGRVFITLTEQILAVEGNAVCDIQLTDEKTGIIYSTKNFIINIDKTAVNNSVIESTDEFDALNHLIATNKKINEELEANETVRQENEAERIEAETARQSSEIDRQNAETQRNHAEAARIENENIRITNENTRQANETVRQDQETDRENNTAAAIANAKIAAKNAQDAADDLQAKLDSHHFVLTEDKDIAGGVPSLDNNAKVPIAELYDATTTTKGITQLTDSITSTSTITAATPNSVKTVNDALTAEKNRATTSESTITNNLNSEISRAELAEQTITNNLNAEVTRATNAENNLNSNKVDKTTVATSSTLGLIKSGTDITVDSSGNVSVNDNSHKHIVSNISDLTATASELNVLDGITASTTELNYTDGVTSNIQTQLNTKAPLASPTLTGTPKAPTASSGTNTTQIATTAFVQNAVSNHNTSTTAHSDIRELISGLTTRLNALADSDDTTLDQLSEIVAYIKSNRTLIESVTTNKVNVSDIVNSLTSTATNKPLSAYQGKVLNDLITALTATVNTKIDTINGDTHIQATKSGTTATIAHKDTSRTNTTSTVSPSLGGTFTAVKSITSDLKGHVTTVDTETITLPAYSVATQSASGLVSSSDKTKLDFTNIAYCTCSTAAATSAKVATIDGNSNFSLQKGAIAIIKFSATNTASGCTLNVGNTGAKSIWYSTAVYTSTSSQICGYANRTLVYVYDGTYWVWLFGGYDANTIYSNATLGQGYGTCATAATTTAKIVTLSSYALVVGGIVSVKFTYAVPTSATLNINNKGAKAIFHRGAAIAAGVINAGDIATFIYDGTQYHLISLDRDTAYTHPTYTARTGVPTANQTPAFGGTFSVTQPVSDATGHITAMNSRTITIPSTTASTSTAGLMSVSDKTKLDGITESADSVSFTRSLSSGTKVGTITINGTNTDLYAPTNTDTHYTSKNVVGSSTATSNTTSALTNGNVYLNSVENGSVTSSHKISGSGATTVTTDASGNIVITSTDTNSNTTYSAGTGLTLSGTTFNHSNSVTAGTAQGEASKTLSFGGTFTIPTVTYDACGHITGKGTTTMTMPANPNVDTKVTNTLSATTKAYITGTTSATTNTGTQVFDTGVYLDTTAGTLTATTFQGSLSGNASSSTYANYARLTTLNPSTSTTYYLPFTTGITASTNYALSGNNGIRYNTLEGTTSAVGHGRLYLGNSTPSGTAGNKSGAIILFSDSKSYGLIKQADTTSAITHTLPATSGTILNSGTTSFTQSLTSGTAIGTIKINGTSTTLYAPSELSENVRKVLNCASGNTITIRIPVATTTTIAPNVPLKDRINIYLSHSAYTSASYSLSLQTNNGNASVSFTNINGGNIWQYYGFSTSVSITDNIATITLTNSGFSDTRFMQVEYTAGVTEVELSTT